jgi:hypothetical protein
LILKHGGKGNEVREKKGFSEGRMIIRPLSLK